MFEITDEIIQSHIDKVKYVIESISEYELTVLVGPNGVGKSLIRKMLYSRFYHKYHQKNVVRSVSMELRTSSRPDLGAMSTIFHDNDTSPTSVCTYDLINHMIPDPTQNVNHFYIFDEPDIGMSRESEVAIARHIWYLWCQMKENGCKGALVITHSDDIVNQLVLSGSNFVHLGYNVVDNDYDSWLNRNIESTDFNWLDEWSTRLFVAVRNRSRPVGD